MRRLVRAFTSRWKVNTYRTKASRYPAWLNVGLRLHLHPYFVFAFSEGSDESVKMRRLVRAFTSRWKVNTYRTKASRYPAWLNFGLRLHLHPYFVFTFSEGSDESVKMHRLVRAFTSRWKVNTYRTKASRYPAWLNFGLRLHLHPYFVFTISEGSDESVHMCRLVRAFTSRWKVNTYRTKVSRYPAWLNFGLRLHLHPYSLYAISEGSGESAHMRRLVRALTSHGDVSTYRTNASRFPVWLNFGLRLHLHPYFVYAISEGCGVSAHMHRIIRAFTSRWDVDTYRTYSVA